MKKITDERLMVKNLKNIRIAYLLQTLGIIGILAYDAITKGLDGMRNNPLWLVFMITTIISAYLSMNISVEYENEEKSPKKSLGLSIMILLVISLVIGFFVSKTAGFTYINGIICGGILFICGIFPILYVFKLRKKHQDDLIEK